MGMALLMTAVVIKLVNTCLDHAGDRGRWDKGNWTCTHGNAAVPAQSTKHMQRMPLHSAGDLIRQKFRYI